MFSERNYLNISTATDVSSDASDIQNELERRLFPLTVDSRWRFSFGDTYTTSPCLM